MADMRPLSDFGKVACQPAADIGERGYLCELPLDRLCVDDSYQRRISGGRGRAHVADICRNFDWRKFTPVIVAAMGDGLYAIIDGQHRATAAWLHPAIDTVPCMVVKADPITAARCFVAINGAVTKLNKGQLFRARLAGDEPEARELASVCRAAGVTILAKNPKHDTEYKPGETIAVGAIERCYRTYGRDTLITVLKAIVESGGGNPGHLRAWIIYALCDVLHRHKRWRDAGGRLIDAMDEIDLDDLTAEALEKARKAQKTQTWALADLFETHFTRLLDAPPAPLKLVAGRRR